MKVKRIDLNRAEVRWETKQVGSFEHADQVIRRWAASAPDDGSYHKTDFKVTFEDDAVFAGRIDLEQPMTFGFSLKRHILDHCRFFGGLQKPSHLSDEQYRMVLREYGAQAEEYVKFIHTYLEDT